MSDLYQMQRSMRALRQAALQKGSVALLDIGSSKITCIALSFDGPASFGAEYGVGSMAGQSRFRITGAATTQSRGVSFGEIHTPAETERAIRTVIQAVQKRAGERIDHVIATFSGGRPSSYGIAGQIALSAGRVHESDIARALAASDVPDFGRGREVLHAQPVNFAVDDQSGILDPRGHSGNNLAVDMHALTVDEDVLGILLRALRHCDLEVAGVASSAYVSALSALVEDEQELGAACIDLGGGTSSVSVFYRRHMIFADCVRMGGEHITRDIALGLGVSLAQAERLKTFCGGLEATGRDDRDMIDLGDEDGERRSISRAELISIIRPRMEEILEHVREVLDAAGFDAMPSQQIVLTGGSSQIPGLDRLAARMLGPNVRVGRRPLRVAGQPDNLAGPGFASIIGLALFAAHPQDEWWDFDIPAEAQRRRGLMRTLRWIQDNW